MEHVRHWGYSKDDSIHTWDYLKFMALNDKSKACIANFKNHYLAAKATEAAAIKYGDDNPDWNDYEAIEELHPDYVEPKEPHKRTNNNGKRKRTIDNKLNDANLTDYFTDNGLTQLQGRRLCRKYLKDTQK